jgi:hypothetical protein
VFAGIVPNKLKSNKEPEPKGSENQMAESQNHTPDTEVHSTNGVAARKPSE